MTATRNNQDCPYIPPGHTGHEPPLTDAEIREIREVLEADRRVKWFWATARRVAIWIGAVSGAILVTWEGLVKAVRHIAGN